MFLKKRTQYSIDSEKNESKNGKEKRVMEKQSALNNFRNVDFRIFSIYSTVTKCDCRIETILILFEMPYIHRLFTTYIHK